MTEYSKVEQYKETSLPKVSFEDFIASLSNATPPSNINRYLRALWYDKKGNWEEAHNIAQEIHNEDGSWIHAYLHRKEGDVSNASYWYHMAGKPVSRVGLDEEWEQLTRNFIQ